MNKLQTFVANRIAVIRDGSSPSQWHHVTTEENPADDASRGLSANHLTTPRWINGPEFLTKSSSNWPESTANLKLELSDDDPEVKKDKEVKAYVAVCDHFDPMQMLIDSSSSWIKLKTSVAWILAVKKVLVKKDDPIHLLRAEQMTEAEVEIIRYLQGKAFPDETASLTKGEKVKFNSAIASLQPISRNKLLCVGGRLKNAPVPEDIKSPTILPKDNKVVEMTFHAHVE